MRTYVLSAVGVDRPGIIAALAERLVPHRVNVTDSQMAILRGHFAMTLVVEAPEDTDEDALRAELGELDLEAVTLRAVPELAEGEASLPTHTVTVYGADHPGILAAVTAALAGAQVNVCDLRTRLIGDAYVIVMEVAAPDGADLPALLAGPAAEQGVEASVQPLDDTAL